MSQAFEILFTRVWWTWNPQDNQWFSIAYVVGESIPASGGHRTVSRPSFVAQSDELFWRIWSHSCGRLRVANLAWIFAIMINTGMAVLRRARKTTADEQLLQAEATTSEATLGMDGSKTLQTEWIRAKVIEIDDNRITGCNQVGRRPNKPTNCFSRPPTGYMPVDVLGEPGSTGRFYTVMATITVAAMIA